MPRIRALSHGRSAAASTVRHKLATGHDLSSRSSLFQASGQAYTKKIACRMKFSVLVLYNIWRSWGPAPWETGVKLTTLTNSLMYAILKLFVTAVSGWWRYLIRVCLFVYAFVSMIAQEVADGYSWKLENIAYCGPDRLDYGPQKSWFCKVGLDGLELEVSAAAARWWRHCHGGLCSTECPLVMGSITSNIQLVLAILLDCYS